MMRLIPYDREYGWTPFAWLIYIIPFSLTPALSSWQRGPAYWLLYTGATVVFAVLYLRSYWASGRELMLLSTATVALGIAFWPVSIGAGAFFIYAGGMLGHLAPPRRAVVGIGIVTLIAVVQAQLLGRTLVTASWPIIFTIIIGAINVHFAQVSRGNARLRLAHAEIEHLAKMAERERIARDLHDLLGHTLSLVILKSELAAKLASRDVDRARQEISDVERVARDALAQVRAAVAGYRSGGFVAELEHARSALTTAGVELDAAVAPVQLPATHEAVLALALREAITNIVRHAAARRCEVRLHVSGTSCVMTITDDGRGGRTAFGSGLTGMRERVEALGGVLARDGSSGTKLTIILPLAEADSNDLEARSA
jgi:two-component system, NarL family, sensor histidine kinase DesK